MKKTNKISRFYKYALFAILGYVAVFFVCSAVSAYASYAPSSSGNIPNIWEPLLGGFLFAFKYALSPILIAPFIIISYLSYKASNFKRLSLALFVTLVMIFFSFLFIQIATYSEKSFSEWGNAFFLMFYLGALSIFSGAIPILSLASFWERGGNKKSYDAKKYWLSGGLGVFIVVIFAVTPLRQIISMSTTGIQESQSQLSKLNADKDFKRYNPTYLPPGVGSLRHEETEDFDKSKMARVPENWLWKNHNVLSYERKYLYHNVLVFLISENIIREPISKQEFFQNDIEALNKEQEFYYRIPRKTNLFVIEKLEVNGNPAIYTEKEKEPIQPQKRLFYYPEDRVRIEISGATNMNVVPKEELIKTAQGLKKIN